MIYNKRDSAPCENLYFGSQSESSDEQNAKTREIPSVSEYSAENIAVYEPIRVSKRHVRRELRNIKRSRGGRADVFFAAFVCLCISSAVIWLYFSGIYAPKGLCGAVSKICGAVYPDSGKNQAGMYAVNPSGAYADYSGVQYLSGRSGTSGANRNSAEQTSGTQGAPNGGEGLSGASEGESVEYAQNVSAMEGGVSEAAAQNGGKSGSDGKVMLPLTSMDLRASSLTKLTNQTGLSPDVEALCRQTPKVFENLSVTDEPLVLILHTHATECYSGSDTDSYEKDEPTRSADTEKNVVKVGEVLAQTLNDFGIKTLHCRTLHDEQSFIYAYSSSLASAKKYLEEYPSIKFIIDLHRDAIIRDDGEKIKPVVSVAGENYAQLMFVVGTNESGAAHEGWRDNLCLALKLQKSAEQAYPGLFRQINLRSASFNQQLSSGYLLLETGSCGNTLDEAVRSARAFGTVLAGEILKNAE